MNEATSRSNRNQFWIQVVAFFAPLAVAFLLYYGGSWFSGSAWRPVGNTNKGELIHPARPLPAFELQTTDSTRFDLESLKGKWNLIYVGDGACDARCREALVLMRQTRLALNDDMTRVQRVFFATANCCDQAYVDAEHQGLLTVPVDSASAQPMVALFPDAAGGRIYIVDPLGNLMMSYGPQAPQKGLLEDLKKLLKLSHIG